MSEATVIPTPREIIFEGRRFIQYGISPVKLTSLRNQGKGTNTNPIIKDGIEYVYNSKGKLVVLERIDQEVITNNSLPDDSAPIKEQIMRMAEYADKGSEPDDECPELTDEQIEAISCRRLQKK